MTLVLFVCSYLIINAYLSHYVHPTIHVGAIGSLLHLGSYITPVMYIYCAVSQQYTFTLSKISTYLILPRQVVALNVSES